MELISSWLHQTGLWWCHTGPNCCEKVTITSSKSPHCGGLGFLNQCYPICIISIASISLYISERLPMSSQLWQLQLAHMLFFYICQKSNFQTCTIVTVTNWKTWQLVPRIERKILLHCQSAFPCSLSKPRPRRFTVTLCPCDWLECSWVISLLSH